MEINLQQLMGEQKAEVDSMSSQETLTKPVAVHPELDKYRSCVQGANSLGFK